MERHASALKAARQAIRRNVRNQKALSTCRTAMKKFRTALTDKKLAKDKVETLLSEVQKTLMTAATKKILKRETASRYISRLSAAAHQALQKA